MSEAEISDRIIRLPGHWELTRIVRHRDGVARRFVATRSFAEVDEDGKAVLELTRQFESAVDAKDLIERLHRRNVALGIEPRLVREEATA